MFIQTLLGWVKSLPKSFQKPTTYGSALEYYIASSNPTDGCDVDRLTREFDRKAANCSGWLV